MGLKGIENFLIKVMTNHLGQQLDHYKVRKKIHNEYQTVGVVVVEMEINITQPIKQTNKQTTLI